jgi:hypothetical protein
VFVPRRRRIRRRTRRLRRRRLPLFEFEFAPADANALAGKMALKRMSPSFRLLAHHYDECFRRR